ncbi:MAG: cell division protein SepF [Clostridia bacterium]|nr:cell division protein SepF [Clostridia bacterium]
MGIMDRIRNAAGGGSYDDNYEDDYYNNFDDYGADDVDDGMGGMNQSNIGNMGSAGPIGGGMGMGGISLSGSGAALEMKVVKPTQFDSVSQIADHLLNKRTVVLNLENASKETARRLIDFLSGVAYSIDGSIKKIATNAYVITPNNVDVGDAQLKAAKQKEPEPEPVQEPESDIFPEF